MKAFTASDEALAALADGAWWRIIACLLIEKVLLVDDEPDIRKLGKLVLERVGGWVTLLASSGVEALELAERELPDVILLDVMMPGMDGPATLKELKKHPKTLSLAVVFLTAKMQTHEVQTYIDMGAAGVIGKPFDPMTLPDELLRVLGKP